MNFQVAAKRLMPGFESRLLLRRIVNFPRDAFETISGRRDPLIPPHGLWFVGGEQNYAAVNEEFDCRDFGRLRIFNGNVVAFAEKEHRDPSAGYMNAGVYVFDRELIKTIPPGVARSLEKDWFR
jgi:hypothetical protein